MSEITRGFGGREVVRVVVDLTKRVIQVHAVDAAGHLVTSRALARDKLMALGMDARIVAAQLAAPYRSEGATGKNDAERCRSDLRGRQPPPHAFRAHQNRGATKHAGRAQSA